MSAVCEVVLKHSPRRAVAGACAATQAWRKPAGCGMQQLHCSDAACPGCVDSLPCRLLDWLYGGKPQGTLCALRGSKRVSSPDVRCKSVCVVDDQACLLVSLTQHAHSAVMRLLAARSRMVGC